MGKLRKNNYEFIDSLILNDATYIDYLERLKKVCLSIFEWKNLPPSMNERYIEMCLYYYGECAFLRDKEYGYINTKVAHSGKLNIYGLPTKLNCYSYDYQTLRSLYTGLNPLYTEKQKENMKYNEAILVMNNWEMIPTNNTIELFAYRLYEAQRTIDTNIKAQRTPVLLTIDENQRLMMENLYSQYDGNRPVIFGDKNQLSSNAIQCLHTDAPYVEDKITQYKKSIFNEALSFLGINTIPIEKKERMITDEANSNNQFISLNLKSALKPRQEACRQFNEKFGLEGNNKISININQELPQILKETEKGLVYNGREVKEDG